MIKYNYNGRELVLSKTEYNDNHTCILISENGEVIDRLSTNFDKVICKQAFGRDINANEILICMTPSMEHPIVRGLALDMEENGLIMCWFDFIRTFNEYYRYKITDKTMEMLESEDVIEFVPEDDDLEEWGEWK